MNAILVIGNHSDTQTTYGAPLEAYGIEVTCTDDTEAAVRFFRDQGPNVIIVDLAGQGGDGFRAIELLRKEAPYTPIIAVSNWADTVIGDHLVRAGATFYLTAPLNIEDLAHYVKGTWMLCS